MDIAFVLSKKESKEKGTVYYRVRKPNGRKDANGQLQFDTLHSFVGFPSKKTKGNIVVLKSDESL